MLPSRYRAFEHTLPAPYDALHGRLSAYIPADRLVTDPLRLLTWGTDASFYRLVPKIVVVVESEDDVVRLLGDCANLGTPVTFRAAGTSLSGQAITDSVLVLLGDRWRGCELGADAQTITLQPGVIGAAANRRLASFGRKIGPDPASIDAAMIGGIAANNASGMCCGTAQNSYHTLAGLRVVLAGGTVLDTRDAASRAAFIEREPRLVRELDALARSTRANETLAARIRHKFRLKNTTGYSLNALVDFTDPMNPRKVGRYQLEDYGSHDIIVENDILYQAYYDGGVRVVDVSGMLLGNLYDQGREIAVFKPYDPEGYTANAPFVMNAMPWKGHVLFTDFNSGLWVGKLEPAAASGR